MRDRQAAQEELRQEAVAREPLEELACAQDAWRGAYMHTSGPRGGGAKGASVPVRTPPHSVITASTTTQILSQRPATYSRLASAECPF